MKGRSFKVVRLLSLAEECCWVLQQPGGADRFGHAAEPVLHWQCGQGLEGSADCLRSTGITQKTMLDLGLPAPRSSRLLGDAALPEHTHTAVFLDNVVISSSHVSISGRAVERG